MQIQYSTKHPTCRDRGEFVHAPAACETHGARCHMGYGATWSRLPCPGGTGVTIPVPCPVPCPVTVAVPWPWPSHAPLADPEAALLYARGPCRRRSVLPSHLARSPRRWPLACAPVRPRPRRRRHPPHRDLRRRTPSRRLRSRPQRRRRVPWSPVPHRLPPRRRRLRPRAPTLPLRSRLHPHRSPPRLHPRARLRSRPRHPSRPHHQPPCPPRRMKPEKGKDDSPRR